MAVFCLALHVSPVCTEASNFTVPHILVTLPEISDNSRNHSIKQTVQYFVC